MSSDIQRYDIVCYDGYGMQLEGRSHFTNDKDIPMIDGQVIKSAYAGEKKKGKRSLLPNALVLKEFGKKTFNVHSAPASSIMKLENKVLVINTKNAEIWLARAVIAASLLIISYLALKRIGLI